MILRAGLSATHLVTFASGHPDGDVTWQVLADDGSVIDTGVITPAVDAVSVNIPLSSVVTTLPGGELTAPLDVVWSYAVAGSIVNGESRYTIEARLPLGISSDGVRRKLGVSVSELPDSEISLVGAYLQFVEIAGPPIVGTSPLYDLRVQNAVEALAALILVPTMPIRIAASESSGTNEFKRQTINWDVVAADLQTLIDAGLVAVDPTYDPFALEGALFLLATPSTDAFTGQTGT